MNKDELEIIDDSNDRKYFTIIPNYVMNHSSVYDRDLYIQMKRIAGESRTCWMSQATLSKKCGISVNRLKKSLSYLLEHGWIIKIGQKLVESDGGFQTVNEYKIANLWKKNIEFYEAQGISPDDRPIKNDIPQGISPDDSKVCHQKTTNNNHRTNKEYIRAETPSQKASSFFKKEATYNDLFVELSIDRNKEDIAAEFSKFINYWTEPNKSGTKQRWQLQQTFDVKRRLITWLDRANTFSKPATDNSSLILS